MKVKSIYLNGSQDILEYPTGEIEPSTLKYMLKDAVERKIPRSAIVVFTKEQRAVRNSPDFGYVQVQRKIRLGELYKIYRLGEGKEFSFSDASGPLILSAD